MSAFKHLNVLHTQVYTSVSQDKAECYLASMLRNIPHRGWTILLKLDIIMPFSLRETKAFAVNASVLADFSKIV